MGDTPTFRLPYPEGSDPVNVPQDVKDLADRVDYLLGLLTVGPAVAYANLGSGSRPVTTTESVLATLNRPLIVPDGHEGMFLANLYSQWTFTDPALNKTAVAWLQWQKDGGAWQNSNYPYGWGARGVAQNKSPEDPAAGGSWSQVFSLGAGSWAFRVVSKCSAGAGTVVQSLLHAEVIRLALFPGEDVLFPPDGGPGPTI